jgi:hypothetical protein
MPGTLAVTYDVPASRAVRRVCVENVRANAFPQVAELFWLLPLLPDENMQVSGVRAVQ